MDMGSMSMASQPSSTAAMVMSTASSMVMSTASAMAGMSMTSSSNSAAMTGMSMDSSTSGMSMSQSMGAMSMGGHMSMSSSASGSGASSGSASQMTCTMSMLWNWYSKDVCLIARSWRTNTKAKFGGSCVGVFALMISLLWLRRVMAEYKQESGRQGRAEVENKLAAEVQIHGQREPSFIGDDLTKNGVFQDWWAVLADTLKHGWFWGLNSDHAVVEGDKIYVYPSIFEHILNSALDTIEWSAHHVVMLLFMYFNGYIFISCMIGAAVGYLLFDYKPAKKAIGCAAPKRCCV
ncbi:DEKNAAC102431 [Brettanomyces naardenensis]|uniref:Copper transport protein n=1 Tax=Brettanomyces naardenensis TaxID=13370 RepID=A0A448YKA3_BRENA|nr:DEKNAAC102431 [Brettanomyces naardenensis]